MVFNYKKIVNDKIALLLKGKELSVVFDYSGVPQNYLNILDKHKVFWRKEKRGLSNFSASEEGVNLVFKWFKKERKRFELNEKVALVIGSEGCIGKSLCKILKGFGCKILDYDLINNEREHFEMWLGFTDLVLFVFLN